MWYLSLGSLLKVCIKLVYQKLSILCISMRIYNKKTQTFILHIYTYIQLSALYPKKTSISSIWVMVSTCRMVGVMFHCYKIYEFVSFEDPVYQYNYHAYCKSYVIVSATFNSQLFCNELYVHFVYAIVVFV